MVTSAFMLGLGLGALNWRRVLGSRPPLRAFFALELGVALVGGGLTLLLPQLAPLFGRYLTGHLARFVVAWALLLVPCLAMGASLPILVASQRKERFLTTLPAFYGINTLGAALGAYSVDAFLVPQLGVRASGLTAAAGDLLVALLTLFCASSGSAEVGEEGESVRPPWPLCWAAFACGFAGFVAQVAWTRVLVLVNGSDAQAFSLTLATYLVGLALGSLLLLLRRFPGLPVALCLLAACLLLSGRSLDLAVTVRDLAGARWAASALLILPSTLFLGALFPLIVNQASRRLNGASATASIYLCNTVGSVTGALLTGYVLLPVLGIQGSLWTAAAAVLSAALVLSAFRPLVWLCAAGLVALALWRPHSLRESFFEQPDRKILFYGEDQMAAAAVTLDLLGDHRESYNLSVDGYNMAGDDAGARRYTFLLALAPLLQHGGDNLKVLVICLGVGNTARAATASALAGRVDCVELSALVIRAFAYFPHARALLDNPKFHLLRNDGRNYLLSTEEKYDVITAEPPPPKHSGVVNLYSQQYYELCRSRLKEGGVVAQWLPVWEMNQRDVKGVIRAFCQVFPYCYLWEGDRAQLVLTGSDRPYDLDYKRLEQACRKDQAVLLEGGWSAPELVAASLLLGPEQLKAYGQDELPLTDDLPYLQYGPESEPLDLPFFYGQAAPVWKGGGSALERGILTARRFRTYTYAGRGGLEKLMLARRIFEVYPQDPYYSRMTLTNPESLEYWRTHQGAASMARIYIAQGEFARALELLAPGDPMRAVALELAGRKAEARAAYEQALKSDSPERPFLESRLRR